MKYYLLVFAFLSFSLHATLPMNQGCIACHGEKGQSQNPIWPNLAGQSKKYLLKEMKDFKKEKTRESLIMQNALVNLSDKELSELAEFYAALPAIKGKTPPQYLTRGERLYRGGDRAHHIAACIACHGPKGSGNKEAGFPVLSGQNALYTIEQLKSFKNKKRSNDLNGIMQDIAKEMSIADMEAVAFYIQGLH